MLEDGLRAVTLSEKWKIAYDEYEENCRNLRARGFCNIVNAIEGRDLRCNGIAFIFLMSEFANATDEQLSEFQEVM